VLVLFGVPANHLFSKYQFRALILKYWPLTSLCQICSKTPAKPMKYRPSGNPTRTRLESCWERWLIDSSHVFHIMTRLESQSITRDWSQSRFNKIFKSLISKPSSFALAMARFKIFQARTAQSLQHPAQGRNRHFISRGVRAIFVKFHSMTSSCLFNREAPFSQTVTVKVFFAIFRKWQLFSFNQDEGRTGQSKVSSPIRDWLC